MRMGVAIGLLVCVSAVTALGDEPAEKAPKPSELKVLERMIGDWNVECTEHEGAKRTQITGTIKTEWILDGWFVQSKGFRNVGKVENLQIIGFDSIKKEYNCWFFDAVGNKFGPVRGQWDEKADTLTWRDELNEDFLVVNTQHFVDKDTVKWHVVSSNKAGATLFKQEGKSTRRK